MELNSCENGSLSVEVNGDEELLMKTKKSSLYLKSTEADCNISSEENTDGNTTVGPEDVTVYQPPNFCVFIKPNFSPG